MEDEPVIRVNFGEYEFEATPDNTTLFRFVGQLALYNHVFMVTRPEESTGAYLFNQHPYYKEFEEYIIENNYPLHDNLRDVAQCDIDAFDNMIKQELDGLDHVPDDWL